MPVQPASPEEPEEPPGRLRVVKRLSTQPSADRRLATYADCPNGAGLPANPRPGTQVQPRAPCCLASGQPHTAVTAPTLEACWMRLTPSRRTSLDSHINHPAVPARHRHLQRRQRSTSTWKHSGRVANTEDEHEHIVRQLQQLKPQLTFLGPHAELRSTLIDNADHRSRVIGTRTLRRPADAVLA